MHRWLVPLALAACEPPAPPADPRAPLWVYAPPPAAWPLGGVRGRVGRSQAPELGWPAGITTSESKRLPLRLPTPWTVPGDGPARAVIYGTEVAQPALELIDVDEGKLIWRSATVCPGPVVGVTAEAVVCADVTGVRGVKLDGKPAWKSETAFIAMTDDRVVVGGAGEVIVLDAASGDELTRVKMPPKIAVESVIASCGDAGRELFATGQDGRLVRIADAKGGPAISWAVPFGAIIALDACEGDTVIVTGPGESGTALTAFARTTGKLTGRVDNVRGSWPARDGGAGLEISTPTGVGIWPRTLAAMRAALPLPPLGELLAKRGDQRLIRASALTAVVLDRAGVRAYLAFAAMGAVLGDHAIVAGTWSGSPGEIVHRLGMPPRYVRQLRIPPRHGGLAVPAELRDLPAERPLDLTGAIAKADTGKHGVAAFALDPSTSTVAYAVALEKPPDDSVATAVASIDLAKRAWLWQRADGCGEGTPIGIAVARDVVVCAARGTRPGAATIRATSREGIAKWEWDGDNVDAVDAAGDTVLVHDADRLFVLDAATGQVRGWIASDDGAAVRVAAIALDDTTLIVSAERGRLVARLPRAGLIAVWSVAVDGVVKALSTSRDGVLVDLEDGDALRIDARTADVIALPGLGLLWRATNDLITGQAIGGPIPAPQKPAPVAVPRFRLPVVPKDPEAPPMSTPIQPPASLGDSWQYTLYELSGGLRTRNDYALGGPIVPATARGPAGSPLVVPHGQDLRKVLVLDPRTGDPLRQIELPDDAVPGLVFSTIVDGTPVAGTVLAAPLRIVLF